MSNRSRARARARARAKANTQSVSFGAGIRVPEDARQPLDFMSGGNFMPGLFAKDIKGMVDEHLTDKQKATILGATVAAPFTAGGSYLTAAMGMGAGGTLGGLLQQKYGQGEDGVPMEPKKATEDFITNTLAEFIPSKLMGVAGKKLADSGVVESLLLKSAGVSSDTKQYIKDMIIKVGKEFRSSKGGVADVDNMISKLSNEVADQVVKLNNAGVTVPGGQMIDDAGEMMQKEIGNGFLVNQEKTAAAKAMDTQKQEFLKEGLADTSMVVNPKTKLLEEGPLKVGDIPIGRAEELKKDTYRSVKKAFERSQKEGRNVSEAAGDAHKAALAKSTKQAIEKADTSGLILKNNKDITEFLTWRQHMNYRLLGEQMSPALPTNVYSPMVAEYIFKGGLGPASALGLTRWAGGKAKLQGFGGRLANTISQFDIPKSMSIGAYQTWKGQTKDKPKSKNKK